MQIATSYDSWIGRTAVDADGHKVGEIKDIYYDDVTGRPEWVAVKTGLTGRGIAPIDGATMVEHSDANAEPELRLGVTKAQIKDAPDVAEDDEHLSAEDEQDLYRHYGFNYDDRTQVGTYGKNYGRLRPDANYATARFDRQANKWSEPQTLDPGTVESEVTIHNQEAQVVEQPETVRLRKYRHTEMVPVTKEEVRVERDQDTTEDRPT